MEGRIRSLPGAWVKEGYGGAGLTAGSLRLGFGPQGKAWQVVTARKYPQVVVVPSLRVQLRVELTRGQYSQLQGCGAGGAANAVRAVAEMIRLRPTRRASFNNFMRPPSR
jgi:hypothetical protein